GSGARAARRGRAPDAGPAADPAVDGADGGRRAPRPGPRRYRQPGGPLRRHGRPPLGAAPAVRLRRRVTPTDDLAAVEALLGRRVQGDFEVVVRHDDGSPVVLRNHPLLHDGTPMPTRYWLVGEPERTIVSRLEAAGGVRRAEAEVDPDA